MRGRRRDRRGVEPVGRTGTMTWLISVPVWGPRYVDIFTRVALPALRRAITPLRKLGVSVTLLVHTTPEHSTEALSANLEGVATVFRSVPSVDRSFGSLSAAHREALTLAQRGDRVCLLTADLVVSAPSLANAEAKFRAGATKLVCCAGMRVDEAFTPPDTESGRALLEWGWDHRHPMTQECTWPDGKSYDLWRMYFEKNGVVVCRLCLPHPIALVKDGRRINFAPTIDVNVTANYTSSEVYLATDPDEIAMIELSPRDKEFLLTEPFAARLEQGLPSIPAMIPIMNPRHRRFFSQRIRIKGAGEDCGDEAVVAKLLAVR